MLGVKLGLDLGSRVEISQGLTLIWTFRLIQELLSSNLNSEGLFQWEKEFLFLVNQRREVAPPQATARHYFLRWGGVAERLENLREGKGIYREGDSQMNLVSTILLVLRTNHPLGQYKWPSGATCPSCKVPATYKWILSYFRFLAIFVHINVSHISMYSCSILLFIIFCSLIVYVYLDE